MEVKRGSCPYNSGIDCGLHYKCNRCGWNQEVSSNRIDKWKNEWLQAKVNNSMQ